MNYKHTLTLGGALLAALLPTAQAQSDSALLQKLLEKGILTSKEVEDLRKETDKEAAKSFKTQAGLPAWVNNIKLSGDFRGRIEEQLADSDEYHTRLRYRYRLRAGLTISMLDSFDIGFRISSGNPLTNPGGTLVGGSPITANQDMNSFESRKYLWLDAAFARWTPIKDSDWTVMGVIGKFDNPFQLSGMVWDPDIVPEGAAFQVGYKFNQQHSIKATGAGFILDELNQGFASPNKLPAGITAHPAHDPFLYGGQVSFDSKWNSKFESSVGIAYFSIENPDSLNALVSPFYNSGNTRDANGFLVNGYRPVIGTASATYHFPKIPIYAGADFPVKLGGEFMHNPEAPANNDAYQVGFTLGKAGKRNHWEIRYRYQRLEADAWFDAMVDDDNGGFYTTGNGQLTGTGKANGWFGGTNTRGHQVVAVYSFTDFLNLTFTYYLNDLVLAVPGKPSAAQHFMVDLNWKF